MLLLGSAAKPSPPISEVQMSEIAMKFAKKCLDASSLSLSKKTSA